MNLDVSMLKKVSAGLKVLGAVVSMAIIFKYERIQSDKYVSFSSKKYDWE